MLSLTTTTTHVSIVWRWSLHVFTPAPPTPNTNQFRLDSTITSPATLLLAREMLQSNEEEAHLEVNYSGLTFIHIVNYIPDLIHKRTILVLCFRGSTHDNLSVLYRSPPAPVCHPRPQAPLVLSGPGLDSPGCTAIKLSLPELSLSVRPHQTSYIHHA